MADATSEGVVTLELHGALADHFAALGRRRGTRTLIVLPFGGRDSVGTLMARLVQADERYARLYDVLGERLPEHVEVVLNDRVIELQGGLEAPLHAGDVLAFLPAHAGG
jgi:molybdopterin converting factor small subunit